MTATPELDIPDQAPKQPSRRLTRVLQHVALELSFGAEVELEGSNEDWLTIYSRQELPGGGMILSRTERNGEELRQQTLTKSGNSFKLREDSLKPGDLRHIQANGQTILVVWGGVPVSHGEESPIVAEFEEAFAIARPQQAA